MKWFGVGLLVLAGCATTRQQPLYEALTEWAYRTGSQVIVESCDRTDGPVQRVPKDADLEQLLAGTGLHYEAVNSRTVVVLCP